LDSESSGALGGVDPSLDWRVRRCCWCSTTSNTCCRLPRKLINSAHSARAFFSARAALEAGVAAQMALLGLEVARKPFRVRMAVRVGRWNSERRLCRSGTGPMCPALGGGVSAVMLLGVGTAMVYPTWLAPGATSPPHWRATALGVYRFWRDAGFAVGPISLEWSPASASASTATWTVAAFTAVSGSVVA
jgi:hypothetical protein